MSLGKKVFFCKILREKGGGLRPPPFVQGGAVQWFPARPLPCPPVPFPPSPPLPPQKKGKLGGKKGGRRGRRGRGRRGGNYDVFQKSINLRGKKKLKFQKSPMMCFCLQ